MVLSRVLPQAVGRLANGESTSFDLEWKDQGSTAPDEELYVVIGADLCTASSSAADLSSAVILLGEANCSISTPLKFPDCTVGSVN